MKDDIKILNVESKNPFKHLIGKTTIEMRDKDGKLVYQHTDKNMLTDFLGGKFLHEIGRNLGKIGSSWQDRINGIRLIPYQEEEDIHNTMPPISATNDTGIADLNVNSTGELFRMSYNLTESGRTEYGYKYVWDASLEQCNGTISAIELLSYSPYTHTQRNPSRDYSDLGIENFGDSSYYGNTVPCFFAKYSQNSANESNQMLPTIPLNIIDIDWDTDTFLAVIPDFTNDKKIKIATYSFDRSKYDLAYHIHIEEVDSFELTFSSSLNYFTTATGSVGYPWSCKKEGTNLYMIHGSATYAQSSSQMRIIKVDLTNHTFTDETKTLTKNLHCLTSRVHGTSSGRDDTKYQQYFFYKDLYPVLDGYVYYISADKKYVKLNLNNIADISVLGDKTGQNLQQYAKPCIVSKRCIIYPYSTYSTSSQRTLYQGIDFDGTDVYVDLRYTFTHSTATYTNNGVFSTSSMSDKIESTTAMTNMFDLTDGVLTNTLYMDVNDINACAQYFEQMTTYGNITINNIQTVQKTADKTMRIIYEIEMPHEVV